MSLKALSLETLSQLDEKIAEAFRRHLDRASHDCYDRPGDNKPRKITLEVALVPVLEDDGGCKDVKVQVQVASAVPKHKTKVISVGLRPNASLVFNPDSLDDVNQTTLLPDFDQE
jgi:hypothetical protein